MHVRVLGLYIVNVTGIIYAAIDIYTYLPEIKAVAAGQLGVAGCRGWLAGL